MRLLFLLFIIIPIVEMALLIKVGSTIGAGYTILLVLFTAALGAWLLRRYSFQLIMDIRQKLERGELPAKTMLEGVLLAVGGALLLTPGFFTDAIGFAFLIPHSRSLITQFFIDKGMVKVAGAAQFSTNTKEEGRFSHYHHESKKGEEAKQSTIIEGEYTRED